MADVPQYSNLLKLQLWPGPYPRTNCISTTGAIAGNVTSSFSYLTFGGEIIVMGASSVLIDGAILTISHPGVQR